MSHFPTSSPQTSHFVEWEIPLTWSQEAPSYKEGEAVEYRSLDCASAFDRRLEHIGREIYCKFTWQTWGLKRDPLNWLSG